MNFFHDSEVAVLLSVLAIDLTLTIDNAVILAAVAAQVPVNIRKRALMIGIIAAAVFRILLAGLALQFLKYVGLMFAGGILLLWVTWKLFREISRSKTANSSDASSASSSEAGPGKELVTTTATTTMKSAVSQILIADFSMSLDNTLAVAGAARHHFWIMILGLSLSVVLMGFAAYLITHFIEKYRWISYVGLVVVLGVALSMIWEGGQAVINSF